MTIRYAIRLSPYEGVISYVKSYDSEGLLTSEYASKSEWFTSLDRCLELYHKLKEYVVSNSNFQYLAIIDSQGYDIRITSRVYCMAEKYNAERRGDDWLGSTHPKLFKPMRPVGIPDAVYQTLDEEYLTEYKKKK